MDKARARSWPLDAKNGSLEYVLLLEWPTHISKLVLTFEVEKRSIAHCRIRKDLIQVYGYCPTGPGGIEVYQE